MVLVADDDQGGDPHSIEPLALVGQPHRSRADPVGVGTDRGHRRHHLVTQGIGRIGSEQQFDPLRFWQTAQELPTYAQPRFVRVIDGMKTTATFKVQKTQLRKDGIDPVAQQGNLFLRQDDGYIPLTQELWEGVQQGRVRL